MNQYPNTKSKADEILRAVELALLGQKVIVALLDGYVKIERYEFKSGSKVKIMGKN